jgi:sirohydrochlorin ferrochelatase
VGADNQFPGALPRRTSRYRRSGRHRSPHQLSLPPDAPALVLAVPGAASPASEEIVTEVAAFASASGPGDGIRVGYLSGETMNLRSVLSGLPAFGVNGGTGVPRAVVVPLLACPHAGADAALAAAVQQSGVPVIVAAHLGPHPLLAEALHARLAEAGLARSGRTGRIGFVSTAEGVLVGTVGGADAVATAGVVSVLLAGRLAAPAAPAALDDAASVAAATGRLREARASQLAIAPCVIGPECDPRVLAAAAADAGAQHAQPLGAHPAIGQLVTVRYGAALEDPRLVGPAR